MKGYIVIDTEVVDQEAYSEFVGKIPAVIAVHGGRFLVRSSNAETVQGDWEPKRFVILEFDSPEAARKYLGSAEFMALDELRRRASHSRIVILEGCD